MAADRHIVRARVSRQPGHLSAHTVRTAEDIVGLVNVYESREAADVSAGVFLPHVLDEMGDRVAVVGPTDGSVLDLRWSLT